MSTFTKQQTKELLEQCISELELWEAIDTIVEVMKHLEARHELVDRLVVTLEEDPPEPAE
jgi:hypothetical protein